jgi:shikimate kinase
MISHGAITVVNAIPCGAGAAVGIELTTRADFRICGTSRDVRIMNDPHEDTVMAGICVRNTFDHFNTDEPEGWSLITDSDIPVSRGLKSSSSACNAIISSVTERIGREMDEMELIRLGVRCAREAKVTVTGAFDDACACRLGGLVIADNTRDELLRRTDAEENDIILLVPEEKIRKSSVDGHAYRSMAEKAREIVKLAEKDWYSALTKNGEMISRIGNMENRIAEDALNMGALAASISGTGPAVSVVIGKREGPSFLRDLGHAGYDAILTRTR